jgi:hypothetical protein
MVFKGKLCSEGAAGNTKSFPEIQKSILYRVLFQGLGSSVNRVLQLIKDLLKVLIKGKGSSDGVMEGRVSKGRGNVVDSDGGS